MSKWKQAEHVRSYLEMADGIPHRTEGEGVLLDHVPQTARRILDIGTGNGRLLSLVRRDRPEAEYVALDFSPVMLEKFRERFAGDARISVVEHDLDTPLPDVGRFDAVVSCFAIHHCTHERKHALYQEIFNRLEPGGVFCNLDHVSSPTARLHDAFLRAMGLTPETEDPANKLLDLEMQLGWLRQIGFEDVDCHWKWLELALLAGVKPA